MSLVLNQFKPMVYSKFSENSDAVWKVANEQTKALVKEHPDIRKDIRNFVYPLAGLYVAMQSFVSKEEAKKMMLEYVPVPANKLRKLLLFLTGIPGVTAYIWKNIEKIMRKSGSEKKGYKSKFYGRNGNEAAMDVLECPLHEAFKKLGVPEITAVVCAMDLIYSTGYKGIKFSRAKALGNGDDCCTYRYKKE